MILSARFGRATGHVPAPARNMRTVIRPQCGKPRRKESLPWTTGTCATQRGCVLSSCFEQKWLKSPGSNTGGADVSAARGTGRRRRTPSPACPRGSRGPAPGSPPADRARLVRGPELPLPESPAEGQGSALETPGRAGTALWRGRLPEEGLRAVFRADAADAAGELGRWLARAQPLPDARARGAVAQGGAKAGGHPGVDRARGPRRPRRGNERQGQGRDRAGLRVPRHRQPHGPRDARVLGPEAHAAGAVTQPPTHTSSRSL